MRFNKLIPELSVSDIKNSLNFYTKILKFKIEYERAEHKFAFLSYLGSQLMIEEINENWNTAKTEYPFGRGINFQIETNESNDLIQRLKKKKYPLFKDVMDNWYRQDDKLLGCREFLVQDPDGYLLRFSEDIGEKSN